MPDSDFTNDNKPVDFTRPMHRINSPSTNADNQAPDGKGLDCGCRSPKDFISSTFDQTIALLGKTALGAIPGIGPILTAIDQGIATATNEDFLNDLFNFLEHTVEGQMFARYLASVPEWVPVNRRSKDFQEQEIEIEGRILRSYQACADTPFFQWTHWHAWTLNVQPDQSLYSNVAGPGNKNTDAETDALNSSTEQWEFVDQMENNVACALDCGAFYLPPGDYGDSANDDGLLQHPPGVMFDPNWAQAAFWPQTGDYVWAAGRWVYDCAHRTSEDPDAPPLMSTQLHPCKAIAWARNDTFQFDTSEGYVPATRFMFFSSKRGGYFDFASLKGDESKDYVFIVDLPKPKILDREIDIGETNSASDEDCPGEEAPNFPMNTLVLPPQLRIDVKYAPFGANNLPQATADVNTTKAFQFATVEPFIDPIWQDDPSQPPQQVKITIPMSQLTDQDDGYGVMISMGWSDIDGSQADSVKKVTVKFDHLLVGDRDYRGHWRLNFCANGRWGYWADNDVDDGNTYAFTTPVNLQPFTLYVRSAPGENGTSAPGSFLNFSVHGFARRGLGGIMEEAEKDRLLTTGGLIKMKDPGLANLQQNLNQYYSQLPQSVQNSIPIQVFKNLPADIIFGEGHVATWNDDIDNKITGGQDKDIRASAVARELSRPDYLKLDTRDHPLGILDRDERTLFEETNGAGAVFHSALNMANLVQQIKSGGAKESDFQVSMRQCDQRSGTDTQYFLLNSMSGPGEIRDYTLFLNVTVEDQPTPQPQSQPSQQQQQPQPQPSSS